MSGVWTDEDIRLLKEMLLERCTLSEIAQELGRTYRSVERKVSKLGIGNGRGECQPFNLDRASKVLDLLGKSKSMVEISKILGLYYTSVIRMVRRLKRRGLVVKISGRYKVTQRWYQDTE